MMGLTQPSVASTSQTGIHLRPYCSHIIFRPPYSGKGRIAVAGDSEQGSGQLTGSRAEADRPEADRPPAKAVKGGSDYQKMQKAKRRNPVKAVEPLPAPGQAKWLNGQLLPEGWERMSAQRKVSELYLGQRGAIFWINRAAWAACISVVAGWVLFRFIGPALGLYELKESFTSAPNI